MQPDDGGKLPELKFQECKPLNGLPTSRCLGGMNSECLEGTGGPLCGLCEPEWYLTPTQTQTLTLTLTLALALALALTLTLTLTGAQASGR